MHDLALVLDPLALPRSPNARTSQSAATAHVLVAEHRRDLREARLTFDVASLAQMKRVRFAPSPTGSLHVGNALSAVANRGFGDWMLLRIDDTDPARNVAGGRGGDPRRPRVARRRVGRGPGSAERASGALPRGRGPARRSLRGDHAAARGRQRHLPARDRRRRRRLRHHARDPRQRPPAERGRPPPPARGARDAAARVPAPRPDPRRGRQEALQARARRHRRRRCARRGSRPRPSAAYLEELGLPAHDVHYDLARIRRLSTEAIGALSDDELAARAGAPVSLVPVLRGARDLAEAREYAASVTSAPGRVSVWSPETLVRFRELRERANGDARPLTARARSSASSRPSAATSSSCARR